MDVKQVHGGRRKARPGAWAAVAAAAVVLWALPVAAQAAGRVALVIGNSAYEKAPLLANPGNDARAVGDAFERLGYSVTRIENATREMLFRGLQDFKRAARASDVAVVFYAGHGIEVDKSNYLVPVDARLAHDGDIEYEAVRLNLVMGAVEGARRLGLVVLDACRDNPFAARMQSAGATRSIGRGLARETFAAGGTLVAYAAEDGKTAEDGDGSNSPYTGALLRYLEEPGLDVGLLFRKVRAEVLRTTGGSQKPYEYGALPPETIFLASAAAPPDDEGTGTAGGGTDDTSPPPPASGDAARAYEAAERVGTVEALEAIVVKFPGSVYAILAQAEIAKREGKRALKPEDKFQDCPECPELVVVPGGQLGRPFAVGVYEVTFMEWDACVSGGGCGGHRPNDRGWGRGNRPAINVSWHDAQAYVKWLSRKTGEEYRLLSGAEWEYVARAGTTTAYWWGDDVGRNRANCFGCGSRWDNKQTAPVGSFQANPFGLHDVHGNVWEWTEDCWEGDCTRRVLRGGSWYNEPRLLRSAFRLRYTSGSRNNLAGFRVARTLTP